MIEAEPEPCKRIISPQKHGFNQKFDERCQSKKTMIEAKKNQACKKNHFTTKTMVSTKKWKNDSNQNTMMEARTEPCKRIILPQKAWFQPKNGINDANHKNHE
jgi:hypothetical protein